MTRQQMQRMAIWQGAAFVIVFTTASTLAFWIAGV